MTQSPAGWYPEPDPNHVGPPGRLRYWDGAAWTEHVHDPQAPIAPTPPPAEQPGGFAPIGGAQPEQPAYQSTPEYPTYPTYPAGPQPPYGQQPYGQQPYGPDSYSTGPQTTTPDGEPLAGWWHRGLARLLDGLISIAIAGIVMIPLISTQWDSLSQWWDDLDYATTYGTEDPPAPPLFDFSTGPGLTFLAICILVPLIYEAVFLLWKQATPGKMIAGLKVRLRDQPGLPAGNALGRIGTTWALSLCSCGALIDVLWPLWDDKKQALHDKAAKTNVVKVR